MLMLRKCNPVALDGGPVVEYLMSDYSIACSDDKHQRMKVLAWMVFMLVPLGFPLGLLYVFHKQSKLGTLYLVVPKGTPGAIFCAYAP